MAPPTKKNWHQKIEKNVPYQSVFMTFIRISNRLASDHLGPSTIYYGWMELGFRFFEKKSGFLHHPKIEKNIFYQIAIMTFIHISNRLASDHLGPN